MSPNNRAGTSANSTSIKFSVGDPNEIDQCMLSIDDQINQTSLDISCSKCIRHSNTLLFQSTDSKKFATLFYGVLDSKNHMLNYCNAGHDNPYLFSESKNRQRLETGGVVLGFVPDFSYDELHHMTEYNQTLAVYHFYTLPVNRV